MKRQLSLSLVLVLIITIGCFKSSNEKPELWIYTSLYNTVIEKLDPVVKERFPDVTVKWFQSGSEKIAAKVNAEMAAGNVKADLLMTSDPFWYEGLKKQGKLLKYESPEAAYLPAKLKDPDGMYSTVRICAMVMAYNKDVLALGDVPKTFKELTASKWKSKIALGSPLESGTNFTTVATLSSKYGWDYYKALRKLDTFSSGGNSTVRRKLESREYQVGVILLENLLKAKETKSPLEIVYPEDGVVLIPSPIAIIKSSKSPDMAKKIYDFLMSEEGQKAMVVGHMYSAHPGVKAPAGAKPFHEVLANSFTWDHSFIKSVLKDSEEIKMKYSKIMFE